MKTTCVLLLSLVLLESTRAQFGGGFYGGGFFGGGFGCPSYLPTNGFQCYQPSQDNKVFCKGNNVSNTINMEPYMPPQRQSDIYVHFNVYKERDLPRTKTLGTLAITGHFWLLMGNCHLAILAFITPIWKLTLG